MKLFIENMDYFTKNYIKFIQLWANTVVMQFCYFIYGHANILISAICQTSTFILNMKIWQSEQFLINHRDHDDCDGGENKTTNLKYRLYRFQKTQIANLKHIEHMNGIAGDSLIVFFLINMPSNCYLVIFLLTNHNDDGFLHSFSLSILCLQQILCIFFFHLAFAIANHNYHRPSKQFLSQLIRWRTSSTSLLSMNCLRYRLKLSNFAQAYHTKNKYGISYGRLDHSLITMNEFIKVGVFSFVKK